MEKVCNKCELIKPLEKFPIQRDGLYGRLAYCKQCHRAATNARYKYDVKKDRVLRRLYGITFEEFVALKEIQDYRCAICGERKEYLNVDHDHGTGKVRALLCGNCNTGLGLFKEDPDALQKAREYLWKHGVKASQVTANDSSTLDVLSRFESECFRY